MEGLDGLAEEAELDEQSDLDEGGEPEEEEVLAYSILDVVEMNRKLNVEMDNTNKALNDFLDTNNKLEAKYQNKAAVIADHEEPTHELEKKLGAAKKEIQELKNDYENQLIIGFGLMKEALEVVEPSFVVERSNKVNLESLYLAIMAKVSGASPPNTTIKVQLEEVAMCPE
ncbi:hypothetical protein FNV43_RR17149 [Rhamnella rubrinervis]|uniref:Uncharacterized protein n=1 Tax=Rhamnella rubrinervis TaxID=2594499 RepID=A0A8K0E3I7_9ROSA|nr:hypothetical protein FNV43_RR17149 [Rhamnella rubrinervis]